jgi:hypothetical protein
MGKIPPIATVAIGIVLIIGLSVAAFFLMIKPKTEELAKATTQFNTDKTKAATLPSVQKGYDDAVVAWVKAQHDLDQLTALRSSPISFNTPIVAWIALWQEYRYTTPQVIEGFVKSFGLRIVQGVTIAGVPNSPTAVTPAGGYLHIPEATVNLKVEGNLAQLERFYRSLGRCPRVATISGLNLSGTGDTITATIPMDFYTLVEGTPGGAAAAPTGGPPGGGPPGMMPPGGTPGAPPAPGGNPAARAGAVKAPGAEEAKAIPGGEPPAGAKGGKKGGDEGGE